VVLSKFFAAFALFLLGFVPWGLFLVALRIEGGREFDYRPLLSFFIAVACSGAGFLSMGLFFSSLTRNQIAAAILTFVGMVALTALFFIQGQIPPQSIWGSVVSHVSYLDLWINSLEGTLAPRLLVFHVSAMVFWLFLTTQVLGARKWS